MLDFNRANLSAAPLNQQINQLIEAAVPSSENYRRYLGASTIGSECLRKIQYDWFCDPEFPARIQDVFARGHLFEEMTRRHLIAAGFEFAPAERLEFMKGARGSRRPPRLVRGIDSPTKAMESDISISAKGDFSIWRLHAPFAE